MERALGRAEKGGDQQQRTLPWRSTQGHTGSAPSDSRETSTARPWRGDSLGGHGSPWAGAQSSSTTRGGRGSFARPCLLQRELLTRAGRAQPSRHQASDRGSDLSGRLGLLPHWEARGNYSARVHATDQKELLLPLGYELRTHSLWIGGLILSSTQK